eukprot:GFKZ01005316.1.p1 GENE.GFKZ01005316.1~~GFKZ01005316.1.p1  ORF type:complete len:1287 (-),score=162.64 GFKZ01005316.1:648-4106(-)
MSRVVSSYIAQPTPDPSISSDVRDIVVSKSAVVAAMGYGLAVVSRGGVITTSIRADAIKDAKGVALNPHSDSHVCIGGESPMLALIDLQQQRILRQATLRGATGVTNALWACPDGATSLAIFSTSTGRISFCDPSTMREVNAVAAFGGTTTHISSSGYFLAATGLGTCSGVPYLEQGVKIFDIRRLETPLPSVMFHAPPMHVMFDAYSSSRYGTNGALWILSPNGCLQCMDISSIASGTPAYPLTDLIQLDAESDAFTGIAVSSEGLLALGDAGGFVHQWTSSTAVRVNEDSEPLWHQPIAMEPPTPSIRLDSLLTSSVGATIPKCALPEYGNSYLSDEIFGTSNNADMPGASRGGLNSGLPSLYKRNPFARFPSRITDEILSSAKQHSFVSYAQAPPSFVRNSKSGHKKSPVVRGTHTRLGIKNALSKSSQPTANSGGSGGSKNLDLSKPHARSEYVEMDLVAWESIEGFDFLKYNKSAMFCGLENALPNVYVNAAVQVLYFTPPLRRAIGNHTCDRPWCISCELGFLFHMFDLGGAGMACEAGNFTRAFMTMANAGALGLLDGPHALPLSQRIENFTRYLLEQLHKDDNSGSESAVSSLFGAETVSHGMFIASKTNWERKSRSFQHTLVYDNSQKDSNFCEILQHSLSHSLEPTRAFCEATGHFEMMTQKRELRSLPNLLLLGCNTKTSDCNEWWLHEFENLREASQNGHLSELNELERAAKLAVSAPKKLVESIEIDLTEGVKVTQLGDASFDGDVDSVSGRPPFGYDCDETAEEVGECGDTRGKYDLSFVIAHVPPFEDGNEDGATSSGGRRNVGGHLVAYIRVPREYKDQGKASKRSPRGAGHVDNEWWCFNDFVISGCSGFQEVAAFHQKWKTPCLIGYVRRDICRRVNSEQVASGVNVREVIGSENENAAVGLQENEEAPGKGSLLGLDCEFVMVGRDEAEIYGDGSRQVVVPARLALARVSVIRGYGPLKGCALIDDYVEVREPVVDYLTRFSGLQEGDLDVARSRHKIRSLKSVYKRLRCLVDAGCTFVGHGLKSDFRIINFVVPPEQVIDTVTLFRAGNKRLLGLRFLSNALLGGDIQSVTHDSIEDSDAAVRLYEVYLKLKGVDGGNDLFDRTLKELYAYGYAKGWKVDTEEPFVIKWEKE